MPSAMKGEKNMEKYKVEFAFGENFTQAQEWQTVDVFEAESAYDAAMEASYTDGLEGALFAVVRLAPDEFGGLEECGKREYYEFR